MSRHSEGRKRRVAGAGLSFMLVCLSFGHARADEAPTEEPELVRAREEFRDGAELTKKHRWSDALAAFERSRALRPHAVTTFNVGLCERALGQYTRARSTFHRALDENAASGGAALAPSLVESANAYLGQIESLLVRAEVTLAPEDVDIAVDGRPLEQDRLSGDTRTLVSGTRTAGVGEPAPHGRFVLLLDPGHHVFGLSRVGLKPVVLGRSFDPGEKVDLPIALDKLDAYMQIDSDRDRVLVTVDEVDVGFAPVRLRRPAGRYHVAIRKKGLVTYKQEVLLDAGTTVTIRPVLVEEKTPLTQRWWFWAGAAALLVGTGVGVYYATAPSPERPPPAGGGLGWASDVR
ncbi:MAG: PEGA domain-containing protein [Deltaproteobacteria bacterium]|nr:PEGA domain-containing protein [Deltaproteobacteria bacterium]